VIRALRLKQNMISRLLNSMLGIQLLGVTAQISGLMKHIVSLYHNIRIIMITGLYYVELKTKGCWDGKRE